MSIRDLSREMGIPPVWKKSLWPLYIENALMLIQEASLLLKEDSRRSTLWRERHYSYALLDHLVNLCRSRNLSFVPMDERSQLTDEDFEAGDDPKSAPKIDLTLYWHNLDRGIYFGVEAKVLVAKGYLNYTRSGTIKYYVEEGIGRYTDGRYARNHPAAAIVGYVLSGQPSELVPEINAKIESLAIPCSQRLQSCFDQPVKPCSMSSTSPNCYESRHPRSLTSEIRLCHLFVVFN